MMLLLRRSPSLYGLSVSKIWRELAVGLAVVIWLVLVTFLAEGLFSGLSSACRTIQLDFSTVVFAILFTGFGEELLFRGFYQGEFNRVFPRTFTFGETRFGWSLFITATLFGLAHMFDQFNPLQGQFNLNLGPVVYTMVAGLIYGIIREHFGGIVAVSLIHGGDNMAVWLYKESQASMVGFALAWALLACFYFAVLHPKKKPAHPPSRRVGRGRRQG
jgi:membrane protease YdiL (CAAX protease family)